MDTHPPKYPWPLFHQLPPSLKVLYTMVLLTMGMGYIFAMIQIYEVHSGRDGKSGISVKDIQIAYSGNKEGTRLEGALRGPMSRMLPPEESTTIILWARDKAEKNRYEQTVKPIIMNRCKACHDGSNPHLPTLTNYEGIMTVAKADTGVSISTLVRVSHIHMFGLTFIFFIVGVIFSHAYFRRLWIKCLVMATPFIAIFLDVGSWWVTKVSEPFAYVVVIGGALMGVSFIIQWMVSMFQMWLWKGPREETPVA